MFYIAGTVHSKGQMILFNKNFDFQECEMSKLGDRILRVSFKFQGEDFSVINVYGPNIDKDKPAFMNELSGELEKTNPNSNIILCGDFNLVMNNALDIISGQPHDTRLVAQFNEFVSSEDLYDVWRLHHGQTKEFSWCRRSFTWIARRLDYIFVNSSLFDKISSCEISPVPNSDHRGVEMEFVMENFKRGPSYWKFNNSLLKQHDYVALINDKIDLCQAAFETFPPQLKWEYCKNQIKECSVQYSKQKAQLRRNDLSRLRARLKEIQTELSANIANEENRETLLNEMTDTKLALDLLSLHEAQGAQIRSRLRWIEQGERNTKYFLGLEKANCKNKTITALKNKEGILCTKQKEVMKIQVDYYKCLYAEKFNFEEKRDICEEYCADLDIPQLSANQQASCEGMVTADEAGNALSKMRNDSSPGTDGLTAGFYKVFWCKLKDMLVESYNEAFRQGALSVSQRRAIITLIHKSKNLPRDELNNWRPISLTNTDYMILAKALALRLQGVVKHVIFEDQVGYIKGRNISTVIRLIDDVLEYMDIRNDTGALVALDFRKAFDTVNKAYLINAFHKFGFGPQFIHWIKTLTYDTSSSINHYGWLSEFFPVNSGIRQGCPLSPLVFILAVELLACKIRQVPNVRGVSIPSATGVRTMKLFLYADDNTLILKDSDDIKHALSLVEQFALFSGLHLNKDKTEAMWIGGAKNSQETVSDIKWHLGKGIMKILGVYFSNYERAGKLEQNWVGKIDKIIRCIKSWEKRDLSIVGKIIVTKTFLLSQFIFVMQALLLPLNILKNINTILFKFIWKKRLSNKKAFEKVRRDVLCDNYSEGGLNMINIIDMQHSFSLKWLQRVYLNKEASFACIPLYFYEKLGNDLSALRSNLTSNYFKGLEEIRPEFWRCAMEIWLNSNVEPEPEEVNIEHQPLWNNDNIKYRNTVLYYNKANLRDLLAATGLVILLKLDSNRRFFSPCDLEIWWMTSKSYRAPLLDYIKLCASS